MTVAVHTFPSRNVNVFDYRVLSQTLGYLLYSLYTLMFLNVKTSDFQNAFGPAGFDGLLRQHYFFCKYRNWGLDGIIKQNKIIELVNDLSLNQVGDS